MHYANENQLSALKELGFTPTEDKTTLTEVAQWLWEKHAVCIDIITISKTHCRSYMAFRVKDVNKDFKSIPEALSWAIDEAIKYLQEQK